MTTQYPTPAPHTDYGSVIKYACEYLEDILDGVMLDGCITYDESDILEWIERLSMPELVRQIDKHYAPGGMQQLALDSEWIR